MIKNNDKSYIHHDIQWSLGNFDVAAEKKKLKPYSTLPDDTKISDQERQLREEIRETQDPVTSKMIEDYRNNINSQNQITLEDFLRSRL